MLDFHSLMVDVLTECEAHAMVKPLIICVASPNGSVLAMRINGPGAEPDMLAEHNERRGFEAPLTIMAVDQMNYTVRFSIGRNDPHVLRVASNA